MGAADQDLAAQIDAVFRKHGGDPAVEELKHDLQKVLATPGSKRTDLVVSNPGVMARLKSAASFVITGITPTTWFGPGQPIQPQAQDEKLGARGRKFDFGVGSNIQYQPKTEIGAGVPYFVLRGLAENYDLLRLVIETRKDQLCAQDWSIVPNDKGADANAFKEEIRIATEFFEQPTPDLAWDEWLRQLAEDDLVCGACALYPRMNRGGSMHSLLPMDVTLIKRLIDESGLTPDSPSPAYQQILKGVPAVDYTREELLFWMRNGRSWRMYGFSPVEQIITTVNIALRRQQSQLEYYTEGNIPDMILGVPDTWTPDQLQEVQDIWDAKLEGNTAKRRKAQFVPEIKGHILPKDAEVILTDQTDEWFARVICFAFSIPPSSLLKQVNRASGEQMAETAKEEGLLPMLFWYQRKFTTVLRSMGLKNVKFAFDTTVEIDPQVKATTNTTYVKAGVMTIDEAREDIGKPPKGVDDLVIVTASGVVPVKETLDKAKQDILNPPPPPAPGPMKLGAGMSAHDPKTGVLIAHNAAGIAPPKPPGKKPPAGGAGNKMGKPLGKILNPKPTDTARVQAKESRRVASAINSVMRAAAKRFGAKAASLLVKGPAEDELILKILDELDLHGFSVQVVDEITPAIRRLFKEAGIASIASLNVAGAEAGATITAQLDQAAVDFVDQHGAELVTNIANTTRDKLKDSISDAVTDGWAPSKLADEIQTSAAFSAGRADMIARTELSFAHVQGNIAGWQASGVVTGKRWIVGDGCCDDCQELDGVEVDLDEDFDYADGPVDAPPAHPNCRCDVVAVIAQEDEEE